MDRFEVRWTGWLLAAPLLLLSGCINPVSPPPIQYPDYVVGAPDQLRITVLPEPRIEQELLVRPDGKITVELVGDVQADGRTTPDIADEIERRVARFKRGAVVTVALIAAQSPSVTVLGEVSRPSTFSLTRQMRVAEAMGLVGDLTSFANDDEVRVIRAGDPTRVYKVDMDEIRRGDLSTNIQIYGGDILYVPPTWWAQVGYTIEAVLFPFQPLFGTARRGAVVAGGGL